MSFTINCYPNSQRAAKALIAAKYARVEATVPPFQMGVANKTPEYLAKFPSGTVPSMETEDGACLFESNALAYYIAESEPGSDLLGKDHKERAEIIQWISFASTLDPSIGLWVYPVVGFMPFNKLFYTKAVENVKKMLGTVNRYLLTRTFLVGDRVTLADIILGCTLNSAYRLVLSPEHRGEFKNANRWFNTLANQEHFKSVWGEFKWADTEGKPPAPKKEEKAKKEDKPKKEEKKKEAAPAEEEEEEAPKPKPKSKLDLLPPSKLNLEEWKRVYSNNDTKPTAMNWFWENFDAEGFSIWRVDYKYNDELTKVFMSANLIGGFFNRLERARKYAFGSLCVLGEDNKNEIGGYFVIRGQEVPEEVTDAADFESYTFSKVASLEDDAFRNDFADHLAWEGSFGGKKFADAKVFK